MSPARVPVSCVARQFIMKDSYSLDAAWEGLDRAYDLHADAYRKIFSRCGLTFFVVGASSGAMGGTGSQEFMLESEAGEDIIAVSDDLAYAANLEVATSKIAAAPRDPVSDALEEIHTPNVKTIDDLAVFLSVPHERLAKSVVYWSDDTPVLVLMMGNDELNEAKLGGVLGTEVRPIEAERLRELTGADGGSIGPVGLREKTPASARFKVLADEASERCKQSDQRRESQRVSYPEH